MGVNDRERESQTSLEEMKGGRQKAALMGLNWGLCGDAVGKVAASNQRGDEPESLLGRR